MLRTTCYLEIERKDQSELRPKRGNEGIQLATELLFPDALRKFGSLLMISGTIHSFVTDEATVEYRFGSLLWWI